MPWHAWIARAGPLTPDMAFVTCEWQSDGTQSDGRCYRIPSQPARRRSPAELVGGWEAGLLALHGRCSTWSGVYINPGFFGSTDALSAVLRDTARFGVMAVGMTFVIVNKDLDLSVGSTLGLVAVVFSILFAPLAISISARLPAALVCCRRRLASGFINGLLVDVLRVPAFIATLTMLFIGRGFVARPDRRQDDSSIEPRRRRTHVLRHRRDQRLGLQQPDLHLPGLRRLRRVPARQDADGLPDLRHRRQRAGRATYAGIPTRWVRMRAYLFSALCATSPA